MGGGWRGREGEEGGEERGGDEEGGRWEKREKEVKRERREGEKGREVERRRERGIKVKNYPIICIRTQQVGGKSFKRELINLVCGMYTQVL